MPGSAAALGPAVYQAEPEDVIWEAGNWESGIAKTRSNASPTLSKQQITLIDIRQLIEFSRQTGDLRALGRARAALNNMSDTSQEHALLQATIDQRLHQFGDARKRLQGILRNNPEHQQAQFTLYSIALVQGDYELATTLCEGMSQRGLSWIATSCRFNLMALQGQPESAFEGLRAAVASQPAETSPAYLWALATLAELAAAVDHPDTGALYQRLLGLSPGDHYSASEYADWLLGHGKAPQAYALLTGRPDSDRLNLLRAIALQDMQEERAGDLIAELGKRFERSRRRQEDNHIHERARYLLDIKQQPEAALALAELNIQAQQERADWRLLRRAQAAANHKP